MSLLPRPRARRAESCRRGRAARWRLALFLLLCGNAASQAASADSVSAPPPVADPAAAVSPPRYRSAFAASGQGVETGRTAWRDANAAVAAEPSGHAAHGGGAPAAADRPSVHASPHGAGPSGSHGPAQDAAPHAHRHPPAHPAPGAAR